MRRRGGDEDVTDYDWIEQMAFAKCSFGVRMTTALTSYSLGFLSLLLAQKFTIVSLEMEGIVNNLSLLKHSRLKRKNRAYLVAHVVYFGLYVLFTVISFVRMEK